MTQSSRAVPETGVDSGVASASVRPEPSSVEAAARRSYEYEGDRKRINYIGWDNEPEDVKAEWRASVIVAIEAFHGAVCTERDAAVQVAEMNATAGAFWAQRGRAAEARATTAERERDEAMAALREKEEAHLSGLASDIAREIEAHDLFDCPEGTTYVRAAQAIADRLVERFGRASTLSTQNIGKNVSEDGQPVSGSREQRGNEEG